MRICVLALATGAVLALAAPAFAQAVLPQGKVLVASLRPEVLPNYLKKLTALSDRIVELRADDGGKLTPEHVVSLQHELDALNLQYRVEWGPTRVNPDSNQPR